MPRKTAPDLFGELRKVDTPTITNVVATYPTNPICLGLYNPWTENWYTDTSVRCMYPEIGPIAGYAVTCVYSVPDPNYNRLTFMDVVDALDASPKPTILVLQQKFPPELVAKAGLAGEIMITSMQAVGCVGLISNGPSRDIDAIRALVSWRILYGRRYVSWARRGPAESWEYAFDAIEALVLHQRERRFDLRHVQPFARLPAGAPGSRAHAVVVQVLEQVRPVGVALADERDVVATRLGVGPIDPRIGSKLNA